jgi:bacterioferritin
MKGNDDVIQTLNDVLCAELTAINQYMIHAEMCENWGYQRLAGQARKDSIEEMKHAEQIIERILYLDGMPNMQKYMKINVGKTVPEQHEFDLQLEQDAIERLNKGVALCREKGDNGSRALLEQVLVDEERHLDMLEAQLQQIQDIGVENYLSQQLEKK